MIGFDPVLERAEALNESVKIKYQNNVSYPHPSFIYLTELLFYYDAKEKDRPEMFYFAGHFSNEPSHNFRSRAKRRKGK